MKLTATGGTDGASIVLFWPENLPEDADTILQDDPVSLIERMRDEGKLVWFPCEGDGTYTLAIYVRTELPAELQSVLKDEEKYPHLAVRGVGYFGGMEYVFKRDSSFLDKYPHMCEKVEIPPGEY